jgi:hypothetical protein
MSFTADELARYQRHLSLAGFGPEAQAALQRSRVLVIGAGGLGCPILLYLAAAGVGQLTIIDADTVDVSNLQRQVLFTTADAGQPKAVVAAQRLRALNPCISITPRVARLNRANALELIGSHDVVVDGSYNFATRYLVNDACVLADRPLAEGEETVTVAGKHCDSGDVLLRDNQLPVTSSGQVLAVLDPTDLEGKQQQLSNWFNNSRLNIPRLRMQTNSL